MTPSVWAFLTVGVIAALALPSWAVCPQGWASQGLKCTRLFLEPVAWKEAEDNCRSFYNDAGEPGHLLSIADKKDAALLGLWTIEEEQRGVWVGLARQDGGDNVMAWSNGLPADLFGLFDDELLDVSEEGDCARAITEEQLKPTLRSTGCDTRLQYVCELGVCPDGWTPYAGNCYKYFFERMPWNEAEDHCQGYKRDGFKGHLVSIATEEENRFISDWQKVKSGNENLEETWIGLYGISAGDSISWTADWDFGSDDPAGQQETPGGCAEMHKVGEGLLSEARDCSKASAHICKISPCPMGLVAFQEQCLLYLGEPEIETASKDDEWPSVAKVGELGKADGQGDSQQQHRPRASRNRRAAFNFGKFANRFKPTRSKAKSAPVATTFKSRFSNLWKKTTTKTNSGSSRTLSGSAFNKSPFSSLNFRKSFKPSNSQPVGSSNTKTFSLPKFGGAFRKPATSKTVSGISQSNAPPAPQPPKVVSQQSTKAAAPVASSVPVQRASIMARDQSTQIASQCPKGWSNVLSSCYFYSTDDKSWEDAENHCKSIDLGEGFTDYQAHLTTVENMLENVKLVKLQGSSDHAWIGRKEVAGQINEWSVEEGTNFNGFLDRSDDEPQGCVFINFKRKFNWGHKACSEKLNFFCEFKKTENYVKSSAIVPVQQLPRIVQSLSSSSSSSSSSSLSSLSKSLPSTAAAAANSPMKCFPTWKEFENSCYHFSLQELTWEAARDECKAYFFGNPVQQQANLVSVTSEGENDFLVRESSSTSPAWIGMNGSKWLDGTVVSFRAQEITTDGAGTCSYAQNKQWGHKNCDQKLRYICKMPKAVVTRVVRKKRSLLG